MTPQPRMRALVAVTTVVFMLTGCSAGAARPVSSSHSPTSTSTPKPTVDASAGPARVKPPSSEAEAITEANSSLLGYYTASFASGHAGGTRLDLVTPWVTGPALRNEQLLADYLEQKHYRLDGTPTPWTLSESRSTAAQTKSANGGATTAFGSVQLVGCIESTNRPIGAGAPAWTTKGKHTASRWSVLYDVAKQQWLVNQSSSVPTRSGSLSCG